MLDDLCNLFKICLAIKTPPASSRHPFCILEPCGDDSVDTKSIYVEILRNWSWGEPDIKERVTKQLKGVLTVKFLLALDKFDYIEIN